MILRPVGLVVSKSDHLGVAVGRDVDVAAAVESVGHSFYLDFKRK